MKKILAIALLGTSLFALDVMAARRDCSYAPLQDVVRSARNEKDIEKLIERDVNFNIEPRCGGDVLQLAILRGNPMVLKVLLEKAKLPVDKMVSVVDFPIDGAPREIPFLAFAAYYAPRADMMDLVLQASDDMFVEDSRKENILWYLRRNPVLRNTEMYDTIQMKFLLAQTNKTKKDKETSESVEATQKERTAAKPNMQNGELVEPERKFNPEKQQDVTKSDF